MPPQAAFPPPPAPAPAAAHPQPALKPRPVAAPRPAAAPTPHKPAAIPRPAAAPAPRTVARPNAGKPVPGAEHAAEAEAAPAEESTKESPICAAIDVLALAASVAGLVLFYLDYTKAAILF